MIAKVGDGAECGVIHQVGAEVIAQTLGQGGDDERIGYDVPGVVDEMRRQNPQVEMPWFVAEADDDGALGRIGP